MEEGDFHEKLDLQTPILSTRRFARNNLQSLSSRVTVKGSVPFLWETAPGLPKEVHGGSRHEAGVPPPKPPPNRWRPPPDAGDSDDDFTDAMDVIWLSESFDLACSTTEAAKSAGGLNPEALRSAGSLSPTFIIRRYLSSASALAFASGGTPTLPQESAPPPHCRDAAGGSRAAPPTFSPPRACGLELLSPLRLKHALCGWKNPIIASHMKLKRYRHQTNGALRCEREKRMKMGGETAVSRALGSDGGSSLERLDAKSAPECRREGWLHAPLGSPVQSWRSLGQRRR